MKIWENMMKRMMDKKLSSMSKEEKKRMIAEMMPKMMEFFLGGEDPKKKMEGIHEFMPAMMEDCLGGMSEEDRKSMFSFCRGMLDEMEKRFSS